MSRLLCTNQSEVNCEVNRNNHAEENQTFYAEEEIARNAEIAKVLSEEPNSSSFNYGVILSLLGLPFITSSLKSGGLRPYHRKF